MPIDYIYMIVLIYLIIQINEKLPQRHCYTITALKTLICKRIKKHPVRLLILRAQHSSTVQCTFCPLLVFKTFGIVVVSSLYVHQRQVGLLCSFVSLARTSTSYPVLPQSLASVGFGMLAYAEVLLIKCNGLQGFFYDAELLLLHNARQIFSDLHKAVQWHLFILETGSQTSRYK